MLPGGPVGQAWSAAFGTQATHSDSEARKQLRIFILLQMLITTSQASVPKKHAYHLWCMQSCILTPKCGTWSRRPRMSRRRSDGSLKMKQKNTIFFCQGIRLLSFTSNLLTQACDAEANAIRMAVTTKNIKTVSRVLVSMFRKLRICPM